FSGRRAQLAILEKGAKMLPKEIGCILLWLMVMVNGLPVKEDTDYWLKYGDNRLYKTLKHQHILGHAKNVIIFVGDGMGMSTITAARIYKGQLMGQLGEDFQLSYEKFPNVGLSKTYNVDKQVPDSAGTATAIFTGVKSNYYMLGLDSMAKFNVCDEEVNEKSKLDSIMKWAQEAGKDTGVVTTTRITHATPAALYAHSNHRDWECDSEIPSIYKNCIKDIARQLVEDEPGKNFKVMLAGGQRQFGLPVNPDPDDDSCDRTDNRNLLDTWMEGRENYQFVNNTEELMNADVQSLDYLLGLFSPGHMPYALERDDSPKGSPSLQQMTSRAIEMLSKSPSGFVLMVEGGRIDHGHHKNYAKLALHEAAQLDDAVEYAAAHTNPKETLIIVTADHSHAFTINGYPKRGNDILGYANKTALDGLYETLAYANGPGFKTHRSESRDCSSALWRIADEEERRQSRYRHFSPMYLDDETHGGEDVPVYSRGPSSHLLSGTFEENYIAHVIGYSACIGPPTKFCSAYGETLPYRTARTHTAHPAVSEILLALRSICQLS
ncbi:hypothetical protein L9F63_011560, partial [Diploptera punctata]